jgi:hypothetical protein
MQTGFDNNRIKAEAVTKAAALINKLQTLLAWDLVAIGGEQQGGYTVQLVMQAPVTFKPQLFLNTEILSAFITNQITETISELDALDINIDSVLKSYREAGETLFQGGKNPIDID